MLEETLSEKAQNEIQERTQENPSTRRNALKQCLKWHNVIGQSSGSQDTVKDLVDKLKDNTELVLIDDQARQDGINWVDIVYGWVYGKSKPEEQEDNLIGPDVYRIGKEMIYSVSPQFVIDRLESDIRFRLEFTKGKKAIINAILLFDLYLFPTNDRTEIEYFKKVIKKTEKCIEFLEVNIKEKEKDIAKEVVAKKKELRNKLLIEGEIEELSMGPESLSEKESRSEEEEADKKEIEDLEEQYNQVWKLNQVKRRFENLKEEKKVMKELREEIKSLKKKIESLEVSKYLSENDRLNGLTLLPRLVALMDPSTPIIIFSSTGKRSMIEKFKGYDNIITCFEKLRVLGYRNVDAESARDNFENAIEEAMWFIKDREFFRPFLADFKGATIYPAKDEEYRRKKYYIIKHLGKIVFRSGISRQDFFRLVIHSRHRIGIKER